jgi:hypothetical protein
MLESFLALVMLFASPDFLIFIAVVLGISSLIFVCLK